MITTQEFARIIKRSTKTVHNMVSLGIIQPVGRQSGKLQFDTNAVLKYFEYRYPNMAKINSGVTEHQLSGVPQSNALNNSASQIVKGDGSGDGLFVIQ